MVDSKNLEKDYQHFVAKGCSTNPNPSIVGEELSATILNRVKNDLDPNMKFAFFKLIIIHTVVGMVTLLFCPQFSISLTGNDAVFHFFHATLGIYGCMATCGSIFVGSGAIAANLFLKNPESRNIHSHKFIIFSCISFISLFVFSLFGGSIDIQIAISWLLGASIGGILMFELGRGLKFNF